MSNQITASEAIAKLEQMQSQIRGGSNVFGQIADLIRRLSADRFVAVTPWDYGDADVEVFDSETPARQFIADNKGMGGREKLFRLIPGEPLKPL